MQVFKSNCFLIWNLRLVNSNEEMEAIMKIVKYIEDSGVLIMVVNKTLENVENKRTSFVFLCTLSAILS